ncbi:MAG: deoxyribonuclease V [Armatimonadota bacterium]|nr:deoxyribonuclease V [bacterium]MDW8320563.1 deoxyribonuclease V [Armatimonadota bacterium]
MSDSRTFPFPQTVAEAVDLQIRLREQVREEPLDVNRVRLVAGTDVSFERFGSEAWAGIVVMFLDNLQVVEEVVVHTTVRFPYVPGLLSFRESPPLLEAWAQLRTKPDAVLCDAHGKAHPRRFGMACHFGLLVDTPTIGCAKSLLCGKVATMSPTGDWLPVCDGEEVIGAALYTQPHARPVYVSVGHRVDLPSATGIVRRCVHKHRIPEPLRLAHELVNRARRASA